MKIKSERAITLVTLTITIIVLIILASVTTYTGVNTVRNARYYNAISELKVMKTKVDEMYEEYKKADSEGKAEILNKGTDTSEKAEELSTAYYTASQNNLIAEDLGIEEDYRYYSKEYINDTLDVDGIDLDFFVNIKARTVLLVKGIEYQNETYYSLCQIEQEQFSVRYTLEDNMPEGWALAKKTNYGNDWYAYKDTSNSYGNIAKVNAPKLADGMVPIKYVGEDGMDNETITTLTSGSRWANAMTKDGSMWVWIPRFAYRITSGYHQSGADINPDAPTSGAGTIEIAFLDKNNNFLDPNIAGTVKTGNITASDYGENASWILEPAFEFGGESIEGFWFAKFEASNTDGYGSSTDPANNTNLEFQSKPNARGWSNISPLNIFTVCQELKSNSNYKKYFENVTNVDTHLTKNVEWGAVAYLAHSKYGLNGKEIAINSQGPVTGKGAGNNKYNTTIGITASTTKNIYGIYDMSGGLHEQVAACYTGYISYLTSNTDAEFISKYIEVYSGYSISKYGDAIYETSRGSSNNGLSWFLDYSVMVYSAYPLATRGLKWYSGNTCRTIQFYR